MNAPLEPTGYRWDQAKRNAFARLSAQQRAAVLRAEAEQTLARLREQDATEKAKKPPPEDDKPGKYEIDILALEMERGSPHWLSEGKAKDGLSEERKREIRDKHRAKAKKTKPAK